MKKISLFILIGIISASLLASCTSMKKDCQGRKHYRLNNGIYL